MLPIADRHMDYARVGARPRWRPRGCGSSVDERQEKIGYKIREAQLQKIPYMLVVGDKEAAEGTVVRPQRGRAAIRERAARRRSLRGDDVAKCSALNAGLKRQSGLSRSRLRRFLSLSTEARGGTTARG